MKYGTKYRGRLGTCRYHMMQYKNELEYLEYLLGDNACADGENVGLWVPTVEYRT